MLSKMANTNLKHKYLIIYIGKSIATVNQNYVNKTTIIYALKL